MNGLSQKGEMKFIKFEKRNPLIKLRFKKAVKEMKIKNILKMFM